MNGWNPETKRMRIDLSSGETFEVELVVYEDFTTDGPYRRNWRLFWECEDRRGVNETSDVTGQPYFPTMRDAIAHGERKYGVKPRKADFYGESVGAEDDA